MCCILSIAVVLCCNWQASGSRSETGRLRAVDQKLGGFGQYIRNWEASGSRSETGRLRADQKLGGFWQ